MTETVSNITELSQATDRAALRIVEAVLFASAQPVTEAQLSAVLPEEADVSALLREVQAAYSGRGVNLVKLGDAWQFRTAEDLSWILEKERVEERKLSKAALETLSIIAYHQPVTRAEIEDIRGVSVSKGTLDLLLETGWIRMRGRRRTPGRPVTFGTTPDFLTHFGLDGINDLPGFADLKGAGLLDLNLSASIDIPLPNDDEALTDEEDPLEEESLLFEDDEANS